MNDDRMTGEDKTYNINLWINNDEYLYNAARAFVRRRGHLFGAYKAFIRYMGFENESTPDGVAYMSNDLDWKDLDEMILGTYF